MEKESYAELSSLEKNNWWYRARRGLLDRILSSSGRKFTNTLDAGCGTGSNFDVLSKYSENVYGADVSEEAVKFCSGKGYKELFISPVSGLNPGVRFDLIACMDVLEHIDDDSSAVNSLRGLLNENGMIIISVPANKRLWNDNDVYFRHFRRYEKEDLRAIAEKNNLKVLKLGYWNQFMYLPSLVFYSLQKLRKSRKPKNNLALIPGFLNEVLYGMLKIENMFFVKWDFREGTSVVLVAVK